MKISHLLLAAAVTGLMAGGAQTAAYAGDETAPAVKEADKNGCKSKDGCKAKDGAKCEKCDAGDKDKNGCKAKDADKDKNGCKSKDGCGAKK